MGNNLVTHDLVNLKNAVMNASKLNLWIDEAQKRGKPAKVDYLPPKLLENDYLIAKNMLERAKELAGVCVDRDVFTELMKEVNIAVSNTLAAAEFHLKVDHFFKLFSDYPSCIFDRDLVVELSTCNRFFPSANEIKKVLDEAKERLKRNIDRLERLVAGGFYSPEEERRKEEERARLQAEEEVRRQEEIKARERMKVRYATSGIDELVASITKAVEMYVPQRFGVKSRLPELIAVFQEKMDLLQDADLKAIFQERIELTQKAHRQYEELMRAEIIERKVA